MSIANTYS